MILCLMIHWYVAHVAVSRPVAFDIDIDENKENNNNTQNLAKKPQRLNVSSRYMSAAKPSLNCAIH